MEGIKQGQVQWRALPLILQRTVMVAMKAICQEGLPPAAPAHLALCPEGDRQWTPLSAAGMLNSPCQAGAGIAEASVVLDHSHVGVPVSVLCDAQVHAVRLARCKVCTRLIAWKILLLTCACSHLTHFCDPGFSPRQLCHAPYHCAVRKQIKHLLVKCWLSHCQVLSWCDTCTGVEQAQQCIMAAAGQSEVQALVAQGRQQLPSLAKDLTALKLQDFLCTVRRFERSVTPSSSGAPVVQVSICVLLLLLLLLSAADLRVLIGGEALPAVYDQPGFCCIVESM